MQHLPQILNCSIHHTVLYPKLLLFKLVNYACYLLMIPHRRNHLHMLPLLIHQWVTIQNTDVNALQWLLLNCLLITIPILLQLSLQFFQLFLDLLHVDLLKIVIILQITHVLPHILQIVQCQARTKLQNQLTILTLNKLFLKQNAQSLINCSHYRLHKLADLLIIYVLEFIKILFTYLCIVELFYIPHRLLTNKESVKLSDRFVVKI